MGVLIYYKHGKKENSFSLMVFTLFITAMKANLNVVKLHHIVVTVGHVLSQFCVCVGVCVANS